MEMIQVLSMSSKHPLILYLLCRHVGSKQSGSSSIRKSYILQNCQAFRLVFRPHGDENKAVRVEQGQGYGADLGQSYGNVASFGWSALCHGHICGMVAWLASGVERFAACPTSTPRSQSSRSGRGTRRLYRSTHAVCGTSEAPFFEFVFGLWCIGLRIALVLASSLLRKGSGCCHCVTSSHG